MKKTRNDLTKAERRQGIANLFARGILRMKKENILLSTLAKPSDSSLSKPPRSMKQRVSG
jgi:hypothetical protein